MGRKTNADEAAKLAEQVKMQAAKEAEIQKEVESSIRARFSDYDAWKQQYAPRKLNVLVVEDKVAVLRPIGANEIGMYTILIATSEAEGGGLAQATRYLMNELWLDGDVELIDDEEYFISSMLQIKNIVELKKSAFYKF